LRSEVHRAGFDNPFIQYWGTQPHADVLRQMADARALIFPSLSHENCPLTILEAFATGLPVLTAATGNLAALMEGGGGWTFRPGDPSALAAAVRRIDAAPDERMRCSAAARVRWQREFTAEASRRKLEAIYDAALAQAQGRNPERMIRKVEREAVNASV
jgi:glycosyltransferase involved in cell wall biosynthesis